MDYKEVWDTYQELKEILINKRSAIVKKKMDDLSSLDEATIICVDKIKKLKIDETPNSFTDEEKENLRKLGSEIKKIEEDNEILIKHSLGVINNILSGILNIAQSDKNFYDSNGKGCVNSESLDISSITEEA